jgi:hypothetical protein
MTEEQTEAVGWFSEELMAHPHFQAIVDEFERSAAHDILNSIPPASAEREEIYYTYNGAKQFISFMRNLVEAKNKILKLRAIQDLDADGLSSEDAFEEPTDDDGYLD